MDISSKFQILTTLCALVGCVAASRIPAYSCEGPACRDPQNRLFPCQEQLMKCCLNATSGQHVLVADAGAGLECCEGSGGVYDVYNQVCDGGVVRNKRNQYEDTCVSQVYDSQTHTCCVVEGASEGFLYDTAPNGICCNGSYLTDPSVGCCSNRPFSMLTHTCCLDEIHEGASQECCDGLPYDPLSHTCVDGIDIVSIAEYNLPKCDGVSFDNKSSICCNNEIHPKQSTVCYRDVQAITKQSPDHTEACMDRKGRFYTFNPVGRNGMRRVCAGKKIVDLHPDEEICGAGSNPAKYNISEDLCCGGEKYAGEKLDGNECCHLAAVVYSPARATCCGSSLHTRVAEKKGGRCCRDAVYDINTQKCDSSGTVVTDCSKTSLPKLAKSVRKGIFVYKATLALDSITGNHLAVWNLHDVTQLKGKGKKKIKAEAVGGLKVMLNESECYQQAADGETYLVVSNKPVSSKPPKAPKPSRKSRRRKKSNTPLVYVFPITVEYESLFGL